MHKTLVSGPLPQDIIDSLKAKAEVTVSSGPPAQLAEKVVGFDALVVRSQSKLVREVVEAGNSLKIRDFCARGVRGSSEPMSYPRLKAVRDQVLERVHDEVARMGDVAPGFTLVAWPEGPAIATPPPKESRPDGL